MHKTVVSGDCHGPLPLLPEDEAWEKRDGLHARPENSWIHQRRDKRPATAYQCLPRMVHLNMRFRPLFFYFAMLALSLFAAGLLAELFVRIVAPQDLSGSWTEITDWGYYVNRANARARHQLGKRVVEYRFNKLHLRGGPLSDALPKVLVLGDSYTFGFLVEEQATFVHKLQVLADSSFGRRSMQFLNGGVAGWSTATYLAFLEQFGDEIGPEMVIVFLNTDDIGRSIKNQLYLLDDLQTLELRLHKNQLKVAKYKRFFNNLPLYQWLLEHSHFIQFLRVRFVTYFQSRHGESRFTEMIVPASPDLSVAPDWARAYGHALFRRMKRWCDNRDVRFLVVTTGFHFAAHSNGKAMDPTAAFMQAAPDIFAHENIPFKDITPEVESAIVPAPERFIIAGDGHPNEAAHALIARSTWSWLQPRLQNVLHR